METMRLGLGSTYNKSRSGDLSHFDAYRDRGLEEPCNRGHFRVQEEGRVREALSFLDTLRPPILKAQRRGCCLDWSLRFQAFANKEWCPHHKFGEQRTD